MSLLDWLAASFLFLYLPIPAYWLTLHPLAGFWRTRQRAAYRTAGLGAWAAGAAYLFAFGQKLYAGAEAPVWAVAAGLALVLADFAVLFVVHRHLGGDRLWGKAELEGRGQLAVSGLYARVRHPRYAAMIGGMLGVCLMAGTLLLWVSAAVWLLLMLLAIRLEERELAARFGDSYREYRRRVPAFLPFRVGSGREQSAAADHSSFRR